MDRRTARTFFVLASLALLFSLSSAFAAGDRYPTGLREPLPGVLHAAAPNEFVPVSIVFKERVSRERIALLRAGREPAAARRAVVAELRGTARASQAALISRLRSLSLEGRVTNIRPLWIGNVVGVDATPDVVRELAARPEVDWINHNPKVDVSLTSPRPDGGDPADGFRDAGAGVDEIECGVDLMKAPQVWSDFGVDGDGAVVAVVDSGVCWTHPDIVSQVWVNPGEDLDGDGEVMDPDDENGVDDDNNGFVDDLVGWDFDAGDNHPEDTNSHGSHCAGTVAGDGTSGTQAGMAPNARIMIVEVGLSFTDEVSVWQGMEYAADNGADAISMSLGWPHDQSPDRATWRQNANNTIDAGVTMVVAAGNEGGGNEPDNVRTPGDVPRIITVGAVDCGKSAASFTSRGPVEWETVDPYNDHPYPPGLVKPDVAAPGVSTKSHATCSGYSFKSGTSMATPHVAGAVALMKSANPGLSHDEIKQALELTAEDLGAAGKDNTFGSGFVDAYAAVDEVFGLTLEAVTVGDANPDYGNGDGGVDTGEIITLTIDLRNQWDDQTATDVEGFLTTTTPGVTLVHDFGRWPDVPPLGIESSLAPSFSLRVDNGCNFPIHVRLQLAYSGRESRASFDIVVGSPFDRTLLVDDFESAQGWTVETTAATGAFVREDPTRVQDSGGLDAQPEDDHTADPGRLAWVTGNDGAVAGEDDVDNGATRLTSPAVDATDFSEIVLKFAFWFYAFPSTSPPSDFFRVQWSRDGATWNTVEEISQGASTWRDGELALPSGAFGPDLQVRFEVDDLASILFDSVVEGLLDDVDLSGVRIECDTFSAPVVDPPNGVGATLLVDRSGDDVRLEWQSAPVDASHDAATVYRVYRSDAPDDGFTQDGLSTETWHVEPREMRDPRTSFYLIVPENGGGTSGEEPL